MPKTSHLSGKPYAIAGTTVAPAALRLLETDNAALLATQAAAGTVDVLNTWFGVNREVQEEVDSLTVCQDSRLRRPCQPHKHSN